METNLWNALHCSSTTTELAVLAIYAEAISYPYMKAICTSSDQNMLNLGPLHSCVYDHMNKIINNPNILVGADSSFKTATLNGKILLLYRKSLDLFPHFHIFTIFLLHSSREQLKHGFDLHQNLHQEV